MAKGMQISHLMRGGGGGKLPGAKVTVNSFCGIMTEEGDN